MTSGLRFGDQMANSLCSGLAVHLDKSMDATVLVMVGRVNSKGKLVVEW